MLTDIRAYDELGNYLLKLPVAIRDSSVPFIVRDVAGLGPVQATISSSTSAGQDGVAIQASRLGDRNVVLKVGYHPDYQRNKTVQALRRDLYSYFAPKREVQLVFNNDDYADVRIIGVVESHEPVIFSKDPEVSISLICEDSYFKAIRSIEINGFNNSKVYPSFIGNGEAGFFFELYVNRSISSVTLVCEPNEPLKYSGSLIEGDLLQISTIKGNKYARLIRDGVTTSVLDNIDGTMSMVFNTVTQSFYVNIAGAPNVPFRLTHTPTYIGI